MAFHTSKDYFTLKDFKGDALIQSWFQKKKNVLAMSRAFSEYNKRFFTLDLNEMKFYYTKKNYYELKDMNFIDLKDLVSVKRNPNPVNFPKGYPHCIIIITKGKDYYLFSEAPADRFLYGFSCLYNKKTQKPLSEEQVVFPQRMSKTLVPDGNTIKIRQDSLSFLASNDPKGNSMSKDGSPTNKNDSHKSIPKNQEGFRKGTQEEESSKEDSMQCSKKPTKNEHDGEMKKTQTLEITISDDKTQWSINLELENKDNKEKEHLESKNNQEKSKKNQKNREMEENSSSQEKQKKIEKNQDAEEKKKLEFVEEVKAREVNFREKNRKEEEFSTPVKQYEIEENNTSGKNNSSSIVFIPKVYKAKESESKAKFQSISKAAYNMPQNGSNSSFSKKKNTNIWDDDDDKSNNTNNNFNNNSGSTDQKPEKNTNFGFAPERNSSFAEKKEFQEKIQPKNRFFEEKNENSFEKNNEKPRKINTENYENPVKKSFGFVGQKNDFNENPTKNRFMQQEKEEFDDSPPKNNKNRFMEQKKEAFEIKNKKNEDFDDDFDAEPKNKPENKIKKNDDLARFNENLNKNQKINDFDDDLGFEEIKPKNQISQKKQKNNDFDDDLGFDDIKPKNNNNNKNEDFGFKSKNVETKKEIEKKQQFPTVAKNNYDDWDE